MSESRDTDLPLSLYIHLPWCVRKCPYCDFNSHAVPGAGIDEVPESAYVEALERDLDFELQHAETRPVSSIFFGGGTPSLFSAAAIQRILEACARRLNLAEDVEVTLEANPGAADNARFRGYRAAGVNRLSLGVQSLNDASLQAIGRIHDRGQALRAVDMARAAGFTNLNLDLMFALPGQDVDGALADLSAALALGPEHLSWYHLTIEPNTAFAVAPPQVPDEDQAAEIHDAGCDLLADHGFAQYETSAFARPGQACRHNLNYWGFGDYLGIGAGAHGKRSQWQAGRLQVLRRARHKHPRRYMEHAGSAEAIQEQREVAEAERPFEFCLNALRLHAGFSAAQFESRTGVAFASLARSLSRAQQQGLLDSIAEQVLPSALGQRHQNRLIGLFL